MTTMEEKRTSLPTTKPTAQHPVVSPQFLNHVNQTNHGNHNHNLTNSNHAMPSYNHTPSHHGPSPTKSTRKAREHRTRSQEWPEVPDIGKIEENNPEILAQKILETGRQIEAGKLQIIPQKMVNGGTGGHGGEPKPEKRPQPQQNKWRREKPMPLYAPRPSIEPPRINNFEDRMQSIITSVLNEDSDKRKPNGHTYYPHSTNTSPHPPHSSHPPPNGYRKHLQPRQPDYTQVT